VQKIPTRNKSEEIRIAESILVILKRFVYNICAEWGKPAFAAKLNKRFFLKKKSSSKGSEGRSRESMKY